LGRKFKSMHPVDGGVVLCSLHQWHNRWGQKGGR
jgi:hypothetical protein